MQKMIANVEFEKEEYRNRLEATRKSLGDVTNRLRQQLIKSSKTDQLVKELYFENSNLMEALYVTEKRQKTAERSRLKLDTKCQNMNGAFNKFVPSLLEAVSLGV